MNNKVLLYCIVQSVQLQYIQMVPTLHSPDYAGHYNWLTAGALMEPYDRRHMRHSCHEQNVLYRKDVPCSYIVHVVKVLRARYQSGCGFKSMLLQCRSNAAQSYSGEMVDMSNLYLTIFTFSIDHGSIMRLRDDETRGKVICFIDGFRWFVWRVCCTVRACKECFCQLRRRKRRLDGQSTLWLGDPLGDV